MGGVGSPYPTPHEILARKEMQNEKCKVQNLKLMKQSHITFAFFTFQFEFFISFFYYRVRSPDGTRGHVSEPRSSFVGVETRNEARLSKLDTRQNFCLFCHSRASGNPETLKFSFRRCMKTYLWVPSGHRTQRHLQNIKLLISILQSPKQGGSACAREVWFCSFAWR